MQMGPDSVDRKVISVGGTEGDESEMGVTEDLQA
jgi:hypothetical protein